MGPFRLTLSKRGLGWSVGSRFMRWGVRADGRVARTFGLPGTGLHHHTVSRQLGPGAKPRGLLGCLGGLGLVAAVIFALLLLLGAPNTPDPAASSVSRVMAGGLLVLVAWRLLARFRHARQLAPQDVAAKPLPSKVSGYPTRRKCPNPACSAVLLVTQEHVYDGQIACSTCGGVVEINGTFDPATEQERNYRRFVRAREERRAALAVRFGDKIAKAIVEREPFMGATQEVIEEMFGKPENVATETLKKGPRVTWRYGEIGISGRYSTRIRFTNGRCDSWKVGDI